MDLWVPGSLTSSSRWNVSRLERRGRVVRFDGDFSGGTQGGCQLAGKSRKGYGIGKERGNAAPKVCGEFSSRISRSSPTVGLRHHRGHDESQRWSQASPQGTE